MQHGWAAAIVLVGLALGLRGLARVGERASVLRSAQHIVTAAKRETALAPETTSARPLPHAPGAESAREPLLAARDAELARAHWVEGRVLFPAGTPADEVCLVVADGRMFSDGTIHRCRVGPDGRFRVAFSPEAKAGWIGLEARMLYLQRRARWLRSSAAEEVTLAPELGGVVTGRLRLPARARGSLRGEVELDPGPMRCAPLRAGGEFVFEQVPCGQELALAYRGAVWLARSPEFALAPGKTGYLDLELVPGVVLSGKVRDERGRGVPGARILALESMVDAHSSRDGSFRLPALEAGPCTLLVTSDGYLRVKRALGSFAAGARRTSLGFVLERGASIAGTVLHPDGSPAAARVHLMPEPQGSPERLFATCRSASDGTFRIQGLLPGAYRVEARTVLCGRMIEAFRSQVTTGTTDVVLHLGSGEGGGESERCEATTSRAERGFLPRPDGPE